jgi:hypothetical protein
MSLASIISSESASHTLAIGEPLPPTITGPPTNQTVLAGSNVTINRALGGKSNGSSSRICWPS